MDEKFKEAAAEQDVERADSSRSASVVENHGIEKDGPSMNSVQDMNQGPPLKSAASSIYEPAPIVPRHLRRGLLGRFALIAESTEPTHYPRKTKWIITTIVAFAAAAAPTGSATVMVSLYNVSFIHLRVE
jgi:hypothetical protein